MSIYSSGRKKKKAIRSLYGEERLQTISLQILFTFRVCTNPSANIHDSPPVGHLKLCTYEESSALIVKSKFTIRCKELFLFFIANSLQ